MEKATRNVRLYDSTFEYLNEIKAHQKKTRRKNEKAPTIAGIIAEKFHKPKTSVKPKE